MEMKKHTAAKLERWSVHLQGFRYKMVDINGEENAWADLLTRWGAGRIALTGRATRVMSMEDLRVTPMAHDGFEWPREADIRQSQKLLTDDEKAALKAQWDARDKLWKSDSGQVLIPSHDDAETLRLRILVGSAMHRGGTTTKEAVMRRFRWTGVEENVQQMFQVLHMDYMYVEPVRGADHDYKYILLLKDDFSRLVRLIPCTNATARTAADSLMAWIADFGTPEIVITDGGSHFTAEVMEDLSRLRHVAHHITLAYCPWSNRTVERANGTVVEMLRSLLNENQIATHNWPYACQLVQHAMNHTPSRRRGGHAPVTAAFGIQPENSLDLIWDLKASDWRPVNHATITQHIEKMKDDFDNIQGCRDGQRETASSQCPAAQQAAATGDDEAFIPGDYGLCARPNMGPGNKLIAKWNGPFRVLQRLNDQVYLLYDPLHEKEFRAHIQRVRRYADGKLNMTATMKKLLQHSNHKLLVENLVDCRYNASEKRIEIKVLWEGFEESDATWEPANIIIEDVPRMGRDLYDRLGDDHPQAEELRTLLNSAATNGNRQPASKRRQAKGARRQRTKRQRN
ncbi:hypothetical protein PBRA_008748 [Plasmodiophora brassicae]|uniref:Integrase catalytic domain-containing protein n=1 Tax=Plasmodiophora brassicae TaxID=37360 RepID=A0A0G4J3G8_PLABS|nr:hypothetical protein PBRA_008748 [Plasmodiophora brassicae]